MKPIGNQFGIDLRAIDGKPREAEPIPQCPGARLRVTRNDLRTLTNGGERFLDEGTRVPADGYGDARVFCSNPVEVGGRGVAGARIVYGICASCNRLEVDSRSMLRDRHGKRDGGYR